MKASVLCVLMSASLCLHAEDPKLGDAREEVIKVLGEPSARIELKNGGAIYSFDRGDVTFDKTKAVKIDLVSVKQAEEARGREKAQREAIALRNAPGGEDYLEKKRQELNVIASQFTADKTPGDPLTYFVHKSSACYRYTQYTPDGPSGLSVSVQVGSDGSLSLLTKYVGHMNAEYNQIGAFVADGDFLSRTSREKFISPSLVQGTAEKVETCVFRGAAVEALLLRINANLNKEAEFTSYLDGRPVAPNLHPGFASTTQYSLTEVDKRALRKAIELSECIRAMDSAAGSKGASR